MPLPSRPAHEWTADDIRLLVQAPRAEESQTLDFKGDCDIDAPDPAAKTKAVLSLMKDISSLANASGGSLVIGVREEGRVNAPPEAAKIDGVPTGRAESMKQAIESLTLRHLQMRPVIQVRRIDLGDETSCIIVSIAANVHSLSMVTGPTGQGYPHASFFMRRSGTNNIFMTTDEIQYKFGQFARAQASATEELDRIAESLPSPMVLNAPSVVWIAIVPVERTIDHVPVDLAEIRKLLTNSTYLSRFPARRSHAWSPSFLVNEVRPTLRGIGVDRRLDPKFRLDIRRDGTIVFAVFGTALSRDDEAIPLNAVYEVLMSGLCLWRDLQRTYGVSAAAIGRGGIRNCLRKFIRSGEERGFPEPLYHFENDQHLPLDPVWLSEPWDADVVFAQWTKQFGNALGREEAPPAPPWVPWGN